MDELAVSDIRIFKYNKCMNVNNFSVLQGEMYVSSMSRLRKNTAKYLDSSELQGGEKRLEEKDMPTL
jgi:hypothetical protein